MQGQLYRWELHLPPSSSSEGAEEASLLEKCLVRRGFSRGFSNENAARDFLEPRLAQLSDPFELPAMEAAVQRLWQARDAQEQILLYGDYDVDGITATAILYESLAALGWKVSYFLPNRLEDGYGLNQASLERILKERAFKLLVAIDCGTNSAQTTDWLKSQAIDVIVLDHHQIGERLAACEALVNPRLSKNSADACLCSAALAFKLAHALVKYGRKKGCQRALQHDVRASLDLAALGIVADVAPLQGENRILVHAGLLRLNQAVRPGIAALIKNTKLRNPLRAADLSFQLVPRLNASGRLEAAEISLKLLLEEAPAQADSLALLLETQNEKRKTLERQIIAEVTKALQSVEVPPSPGIILQANDQWHVGVIGVVAARVCQVYHRPTIILGRDGQEWRGSGRSISGFDLAAALQRCDDLLLRHGGHAQAAGLSVANNNVAALRERLDALFRDGVSQEDLRPKLDLDGEAALADLSLDRIAELRKLEPTGQGNPPAQFLTRNLSLRGNPQRVGRESQHATLLVSDGAVVHRAIWFNCKERKLPEGKFHLCHTPEVHTYEGKSFPQLKVIDWVSA